MSISDTREMETLQRLQPLKVRLEERAAKPTFTRKLPQFSNDDIAYKSTAGMSIDTRLRRYTVNSLTPGNPGQVPLQEFPRTI